jgi:hypothetical protein
MALIITDSGTVNYEFHYLVMSKQWASCHFVSVYVFLTAPFGLRKY